MSRKKSQDPQRGAKMISNGLFIASSPLLWISIITPLPSNSVPRMHVSTALRPTCQSLLFTSSHYIMMYMNEERHSMQWVFVVGGTTECNAAEIETKWPTKWPGACLQTVRNRRFQSGKRRGSSSPRDTQECPLSTLTLKCPSDKSAPSETPTPAKGPPLSALLITGEGSSPKQQVTEGKAFSD